jgi:hypothetical protein
MGIGWVCCLLVQACRFSQGFSRVHSTAGMADPAPVLQTFFVDQELQEAYKLDAVITGTGCVSNPICKNLVKR